MLRLKSSTTGSRRLGSGCPQNPAVGLEFKQCRKGSFKVAPSFVPRQPFQIFPHPQIVGGEEERMVFDFDLDLARLPNRLHL